MILDLLLLAQIALVPGYANTYTDGTYYWAGNPMCVGQGYNYTLQPTSPAIDAGAMPPDPFHCPAPGSALNQPRLPDGSYCGEWFGKAPDIGACEYTTAAIVQPKPVPPSGFKVTLR
jgi:hypothetical protein